MKKVFVTRKLLKENEEKLKELFDVKLNSNDKIYSAAEIIEGSKNFDGILSSVTDPINSCLLYTSPSPRDATLSRMPSSA